MHCVGVRRRKSLHSKGSFHLHILPSGSMFFVFFFQHKLSAKDAVAVHSEYKSRCFVLMYMPLQAETAECTHLKKSKSFFLCLEFFSK